MPNVKALVHFTWAINATITAEDCDETCKKKLRRLVSKIGFTCVEVEEDENSIVIICPEELNTEHTEDCFKKEFLNDIWARFERIEKAFNK